MTNYLPKKSFHISLQPAQAWTVILGFTLFIAVCILANAGGILRLMFPAASFIVGVFLYRRYPILYIGFTWWIWFLAPWIRRLVDLKSGWVDPSPILLAPPLVTLITFASFLRYLPQSYYQGGLPFILSFLGVGYAFLIGLIQASPTSAMLACLNWLTPIAFGFHLFINWRNYPQLSQNIQRTFLWGVLVTGSYGVWQYLVAPEWDRFWIVNTGAVAFGSPEPLGIRVFSTMNSPQPFAVVMMAGLLLLFNGKGSLRFASAGVGYLSLLLSSARAVWLGWLVAIFILTSSLKAKLQMRLIITLLVIVILVVPLANVEPFSSVIAPRIQSLSNADDDVSYNERSERYQTYLGIALTQIIGNGLGGNAALGPNIDSGILDIFYSFGWLGALPYLGGIILLIFSLLQYPEVRFDSFMGAARAISFGVFAQIGLNGATAGVFGVVLWGFLGIALAAHKYNTQPKNTPAKT
ncbi:O-antigen ligase domain-containing protein [Floridanema evergladense]|uniref:O-antigen ligase domain-containing protein n=1 Tax=Floridaenema evergladense BLCC-F167 TaxID=3153639 RepID=A0ABV4WWR5_9CYAN